MTLSLTTADAIAHETLRAARDDDAAALAIAVLDAGGHPVTILREDGAGYLRVDIAVAKAWGSLGMGQPSRQLATRAQNQPEFFMSLVQVAQGRIGLAPGGVLCATADGTVVGAVGVSGDLPDVDERCAVAAIEHVGLHALTGAAPS